MQDLTEEHAGSLLNKEWLVKVDNVRSISYLFKFYCSLVDLSCCLMVTDTKQVWAEVISSKQFARRWRICNPTSNPEFPDPDDEDSWRTSNLELLSKVHTLGAIPDTSFQVLDSNYSDFSFRLECGTFEWRWETNYLGHKRSSEIISKHLILPLITTSHLALSSSEAFSEMSDIDVEKAVDRAGRTARRTVDTHIKNALSKPRMSTTIRRISAMFNFASDLPAVFSTAEKPILEPEAHSKSQTPNKPLAISPKTALSPFRPSLETERKEPDDTPADSATESESDAGPKKGKSPPLLKESRPHSPHSRKGSSAYLSRNLSPNVSDVTVPTGPVAVPGSESESSPARPVKKLKETISSEEDEDSEAERRKHLQQLKSGNGPSGVKRGARQPIKRGGKRF